MEFLTILSIMLSVILVKFQEYAYSMDLNYPPAEEPPFNMTISDNIDRSKLNQLKRELTTIENEIDLLSDKGRSNEIKTNSFQKADKLMKKLEQKAEDKRKAIREMKISMGISPDLVENVRAEGSGSGSASSSHGDSSRLDNLRSELAAKKVTIQELTDKTMEVKFKGGSLQMVKRQMADLHEQEVKLTKEVIAEEMRMQLKRDAETAEVEQAYIKQKKCQRILELQQRKTEIETMLEQRIPAKGRKRFQGLSLTEELQNIEKELDTIQ